MQTRKVLTMTQTPAQNVDFQVPPSSNGVLNVVSSQPKTLYLNKPKYHKEEEDTNGVPAPQNGTPEPAIQAPLEPTHDWQKRYGDLQSYHDKQIKAKDAELAEKVRLLAEKEQALTSIKAEPLKLPSTPEELEQFKAKYTSLYNVIETMVITQNIQTKAQLEKAIQENEKRTKALSAEKAKAQLLEIHPDADTLKNDPDFAAWYEEQVTPIKQLLTSDFVKDVARGIEIYKRDKGIIRESDADKKAKAAAAAMIVNTQPVVDVGAGGGKVWKASEVKRIPMSQYHKYEAEINKAVMEGRYDENS